MTEDRTARPAYVLIYAAVIALVFTGGIMALHAATRDIVERNEKLAFQKAMIELFHLGDVDTLSTQQIVDLYDRHIDDTSVEEVYIDPRTRQEFKLYVASDANNKVIGHAFTFTGTGFWARIDGLLAITPSVPGDAADEIIGIAFLAHQETPGLGGRITERKWREQFVGLDFTPPKEGGKWIYIGGPVAIDPSSPRYGRRVDAITGATGTCNAIESFLNEQIDALHRSEMTPTEGAAPIEIPY